MALHVCNHETPPAPLDGPMSVTGLALAASKVLDDLVKAPFPSDVRDASLVRIREGAKHMSQELPVAKDADVFGDVCGGLDYAEQSTTAVGLDENLLSLPQLGAVPKPVRRLLGPTGEDEVRTFLNEMVLPIEEAEKNLASADTPPAYMDSSLRKLDAKYVRFVNNLRRRGILCFGFDRRADAGVFAVPKKNGKQRLVVDARRSNVCFAKPATTPLPTAASFSRLHVPAGAHLHCFSFDLRDAFYQIELPAELRAYFCLPGLPARRLGVSHVAGFRSTMRSSTRNFR